MELSSEEMLLQAELGIQKGQPEPAGELLERLYEKARGERPELLPRILFDQGNLALIEEDYAKAALLYESSIKAGNREFGVYKNLAGVLEKTGGFSREQKILEEALQMDFKGAAGRFIYNAAHDFYLRREMYLRADRLAGKYVQEYPDKYFGYHLRFEARMFRGQYEEARAELADLEERFGENPSWLQDSMDWYEAQELYEEEIRETDRNPAYKKIIPELTLQRRLRIFLSLRRQDDVRVTARELFAGWGDDQGCFAQMMIAAAEEDFATAAGVADYILKNRKRNKTLFYTTLYLNLFFLYRLYGGRVSEDQKQLMRRAAGIAVAWFRQNDLFDEQLLDSLKEIGIELAPETPEAEAPKAPESQQETEIAAGSINT